MKKRALSLAIALLMVLTLLPATASATDTPTYTLYYDLQTSKLYTSTSFIEENIYSGSGWSGTGNTLTLTGFEFTTTAGIALKVPGGTTIILEGNNVLTSTGSDSLSACIWGSDKLTITGDENSALSATGTRPFF